MDISDTRDLHRPEITATSDGQDRAPQQLSVDLEPAAAQGQRLEPVTATINEPITDDEFDGITIEDYALRKNFTTDQVWQQLKAGKIIGRTDKGRILVYSSFERIKAMDSARLPVFKNSAASSTATMGQGQQGESGSEQARLADLPPLPSPTRGQDKTQKQRDPSDDAETATTTSATQHLVPHGMSGTSGGHSNNQEIALLLDHLSLAKEENRELLKFTQDSIRKVTELTESIVEMKDSLLHSKDHEIKNLQETLARKEEQLRKIAQANEDLETLVRTLDSNE